MAMIVSFSPVTNRETFEQSFTLTDYETGEAIDLSGVTAIRVEVRDPHSRATLLSASLGNGVVIGDDDDDTVFTVRFEFLRNAGAVR